METKEKEIGRSRVLDFDGRATTQPDLLTAEEGSRRHRRRFIVLAFAPAARSSTGPVAILPFGHLRIRRHVRK